MGTPPAEVEVDEALVDALVRRQFPLLAGPVRIVAHGWDNVVARLGDDLCVRLPRRALAAPLVQHEATWLPRLGPTLPVDVPMPVAVGEPGETYPWTWTICPWFSGRPSTDIPVRDRHVVGTQLGAFVAALHVPAPAAAPVSPWRGIALVDLESTVLERLARLPPAAAATLGAAWRRCADAEPHTGPPLWLHGDLHPLNLLVRTDAPSLRAVIDWGDLCQGDPATDLAAAWLACDEGGRAAFRAAAAGRHPPDDPVWTRALGWAVALGALFLLDAEPGTAGHGVGRHLLRQVESVPR